MTVRRTTEGRLDRDEKMREEHAWRDHSLHTANTMYQMRFEVL